MRDYGKKPGSSLRILPSYFRQRFAMGGKVLGEHIQSHQAPDPDPDIQRPPPADAPGDNEGEYSDMVSQAQEDI